MWCSEADSGVVIVWSGDHVTWWWFELVTMWSGNELQWCYLQYYLLSKWWWCQVGIDWSADDCSSQTCNHFFMAPGATKERICRTPLYLHPSLVVSFEFSLHRILRYQQWICCCYCLFQVSQNALIELGYAMKKCPSMMIHDDLPNLYKSLKECVSPYLRLIMRVRFLQGMSLDGSVFPAASCGFQWARDDDSDGSRRLVGVLFLRWVLWAVWHVGPLNEGRFNLYKFSKIWHVFTLLCISVYIYILYIY